MDPFIPDPSEYIEFYSLRQHAVSPETKLPVTEEIYIHSKLIIIDDEIVLMGSANINDRSLMGNRDSEIAMVIEDDEKMEVKMNGEVIKRGKFSHTLRTALYMEHFN
jgi:phospholipase D1/2